MTKTRVRKEANMKSIMLGLRTGESVREERRKMVQMCRMMKEDIDYLVSVLEKNERGKKP